MGVDYVQSRNCKVKRDLGVDVLVSRIKARGQAAMLVERIRKGGQDPMTATITRVVQYPSGPVAEQVPRARRWPQPQATPALLRRVPPSVTRQVSLRLPGRPRPACQWSTRRVW